MSSILIQYATASPVFGDIVVTFSKALKSFPRGGSASAAAAASGDATLPRVKGSSRCSLLEGRGESDKARLSIVMKVDMKELANHLLDLDHKRRHSRSWNVDHAKPVNLSWHARDRFYVDATSHREALQD